MHVTITCKYKKEWMKNSREKVETPFFPSSPYLLPWKPVVGSGRMSNSSKLSCMLSLPASMKRIRSRTAEKKWRHRFSHYKPMGIFSDVQGQLTPQSVVRAGRNSKLVRRSHACHHYLQVWKGSDEKQARKKWRHRFLHYNPMGAFCCHGNQSSDPIWPKTIYSLSPNPMMLQIKFGCDIPVGFRDIHVWKSGHTDAGSTGIL